MKAANPSIAFRVDASLEIGTGHVMRCLTLAEALRDMGAMVSFVSRELAGNMIEQMERRGFCIKRLPTPDGSPPEDPPTHAAWAGVHWKQDATETCDALNDIDLDWLVVDHYSFDDRWEKAVRRDGMQIMVIDDLADRTHGCDLLLDQNLARIEKHYRPLVHSESCRLLLGPRFALLRPEFAERRAMSLLRREDQAFEHILVSMGGVDQNNVTEVVLKALENADLPAACKVTVVLGEKCPWHRKVQTIAKKSRRPTQVLQNVSNMAMLMLKADLAIGAAGSSTWERCCLGLPTILVTMAKNQQPVVQAMKLANAGIDVGSSDSAEFTDRFDDALKAIRNPMLLSKFAQLSAEICDGDGVGRVSNQLLPPRYSFRDVKLEDSRRIWEWRKFPDYERFGKSGGSPSFPQHQHWFRSAISNPKRTFRILELGKLACGYVRLDQLKGVNASISICLSSDARGQGLAKELLREAHDLAIQKELSEIHAEIHPENEGSIRVFESAGYKRLQVSNAFLHYQYSIGA